VHVQTYIIHGSRLLGEASLVRTRLPFAIWPRDPFSYYQRHSQVHGNDQCEPKIMIRTYASKHQRQKTGEPWNMLVQVSSEW